MMASPPPGLDPSTASSLASFLARIFLLEVDRKSRDALLESRVLDCLEKLEAGCSEYLAGYAWRAEDFDECAADYCELFLMPTGALPRASVWLGGEPLEHGPRIAARVEEAVAHLGLDPRELAGLPPDHVGVLLQLVAVAWEAEASYASRLQEELLRPWAPAFSAAVLKRTNNVFYRAAARLLLQFVNEG